MLVTELHVSAQPAARGWIGTLRGYEAMLILASSEVLTTVGFPSV